MSSEGAAAVCDGSTGLVSVTGVSSDMRKRRRRAVYAAVRRRTGVRCAGVNEEMHVEVTRPREMVGMKAEVDIVDGGGWTSEGVVGRTVVGVGMRDERDEVNAMRCVLTWKKTVMFMKMVKSDCR